jgi:uncharacterized protein GlcG (DUF336 family)
MNQEKATIAMKAAIAESEKLGVKMNVSIVDAGGNLVAFKRMDGAWLGSIDIAMKKAKTAVFFDMPCGNLGTLSQPGGPLFGIEHSNQGLITFPGNCFELFDKLIYFESGTEVSRSGNKYSPWNKRSL